METISVCSEKDTENQNLYRILQVDPSAEHEIIRQAFRFLARKNHPLNKDTGNPEMFEKVVGAFKILGVSWKRAAYDKSLQNRQNYLNEAKITENVKIKCAGNYIFRELTLFNHKYTNNFARLVPGPEGVYISGNQCIWYVDTDDGHPIEFFRIPEAKHISGFRFDLEGNCYVSTVEGMIYKIKPDKAGMILGQMKIGNGSASLADIALSLNQDLYVSSFESRNGGVFKVDKRGNFELLIGGNSNSTLGLIFDAEGFLIRLECSTGEIVKNRVDGREVLRFSVSESSSFNSNGFDGNLAQDSFGRLYVTAGQIGTVFRVNQNGTTETFITGLDNPTGITFNSSGNLMILESGGSRLLEIHSKEFGKNEHILYDVNS